MLFSYSAIIIIVVQNGMMVNISVNIAIMISIIMAYTII